MGKFILSTIADEIALDLETQMKVLEQYDINYIEMRKVDGKVIVDYSTNEVKEIKRQLDEKGFKISAVGSPIGKYNITDKFEPHLDLFKHTLEIADILDTKNIRMFSFYIPEGEDPLKYRDEVMERWQKFLKVAEGTGIMLLHENERYIYGENADRCLDLLRTMNNPNLKAIFDPANFVQCGVEAFPYAYNLLKDYIVYMHIKEAVAYGDRHAVPAGYGDGHVKKILEDLNNSGFEGFLSIEPHLKNFEGFAALEPESNINSMPEGWTKKFAMAFYGLDKILKDIDK